MKKLIFLLVLLTTASYGADYHSPYDPGAARNTLSNVTPATGRAALGLGTMAVATSTDYVATSALALRLDTANASFSEDIDVTGDVGAATLGITGHSTLTTASATAIGINDACIVNSHRFSWNHSFANVATLTVTLNSLDHYPVETDVYIGGNFNTANLRGVGHFRIYWNEDTAGSETVRIHYPAGATYLFAISGLTLTAASHKLEIGLSRGAGGGDGFIITTTKSKNGVVSCAFTL